jgi:hypothetical protein
MAIAARAAILGPVCGVDSKDGREKDGGNECAVEHGLAVAGSDFGR